jgi:hypothetical protein
VEIRTSRATVVNRGSINGGHLGVGLAVGGYVTNATTATIAGYYAIETGEGLGTVRNAGKILGGSSGAGTVVTGGTISAAGAAVALAAGLWR